MVVTHSLFLYYIMFTDKYNKKMYTIRRLEMKKQETYKDEEKKE